jgi:hypothetical protein
MAPLTRCQVFIAKPVAPERDARSAQLEARAFTSASSAAQLASLVKQTITTSSAATAESKADGKAGSAGAGAGAGAGTATPAPLQRNYSNAGLIAAMNADHSQLTRRFGTYNNVSVDDFPH